MCCAIYLFQTHTLPPTHTENHARCTIDHRILHRRQYICRGHFLGSYIATTNTNAHQRHAHISHYGIDIGKVDNDHVWFDDNVRNANDASSYSRGDKHQVTQGLQDVTYMRKMRRHFPLSRCVRLGLLDACLPSPASRMRRGARHEAAACRKSPRRTNVAREGLAVVGSGS